MKKAIFVIFWLGKKKKKRVILHVSETPLTGEWKQSTVYEKCKKKKNQQQPLLVLFFWLFFGCFVCLCVFLEKPVITSKPTEQGT